MESTMMSLAGRHPIEAASSHLTHESIDSKASINIDLKLANESHHTSLSPNEQKCSRFEADSSATVESLTTSICSSQSNERKTTQGGRCRLFIGNIPFDMTQDEFQLLFNKYGELIEYFVNPSRGFGFIKLVC
jgi:hypothetical protein